MVKQAAGSRSHGGDGGRQPRSVPGHCWPRAAPWLGWDWSQFTSWPVVGSAERFDGTAVIFQVLPAEPSLGWCGGSSEETPRPVATFILHQP